MICFINTLFTKIRQCDVNVDNLQPEEQFNMLLKASNLPKPLTKYIQVYLMRNETFVTR